MADKRKSIHGQWSRWIFILATTGSAVGLGNIWRFPYITGENGGGAFVLVYLLCILFIGIPIMMAEVMLGRRGRQSPINTMRSLAKDEGLHPAWAGLGWLGVMTGFIILSFYSVVAGWILDYIFRAGSGIFTTSTDEEIGEIFAKLLSNPEQLFILHTVFMLLTIMVVSMGVKNGLERAVKYLMPMLFIMLIILVGYAMSTAGFGRGLTYIFTPDFSQLTREGLLEALGHAFFTLSLGMGAVMIYGSYMPQNASIAKTTLTIAFADTLVAILACLIIFPLVFTYELEPGQGPGLIFVTLPIVFGQMPYGELFGTLFFILVALAAWTSAISLLEPAVAWLVENRHLKRPFASALAGTTVWLLGIGSLLSFNEWSEAKLFDKTFFDTVDYLSSKIMLPLGGFLITVFVAWLISKKSVVDELNLGEGFIFRAWFFTVRYIAPTGVIVIFLHAVEIL